MVQDKCKAQKLDDLTDHTPLAIPPVWEEGSPAQAWSQGLFLDQSFLGASLPSDPSAQDGAPFLLVLMHDTIGTSCGSRISHRRCVPTSKGGVPTYYLTNYSRKLHENEEILAQTRGRASLAHPLDPPPLTHPSTLLNRETDSSEKHDLP